jgi:hypothetical protein
MLLFALGVGLDLLPTIWRVLLGAIGVALGIGMLAYVIRHGTLVTREEKLRREGKCDCGYDLRGAPPKETYKHFFDVWKRMGSTRKVVVCPECGKKHTQWDHD